MIQIPVLTVAGLTSGSSRTTAQNTMVSRTAPPTVPVKMRSEGLLFVSFGGLVAGGGGGCCLGSDGCGNSPALITVTSFRFRAFGWIRKIAAGCYGTDQAATLR